METDLLSGAEDQLFHV
jgi:hypothetical protein